MGILDDAIRDHLELKRRMGARDAELKRLEDEAFGPPARPGEPEFGDPEGAVEADVTAEEAEEVIDAPSEAAIPSGRATDEGATSEARVEQPSPEEPPEAPSDGLPESEDAETAADSPAAPSREPAEGPPASSDIEDFELGDLDLTIADEPEEPGADAPAAGSAARSGERPDPGEDRPKTSDFDVLAEAEEGALAVPFDIESVDDTGGAAPADSEVIEDLGEGWEPPAEPQEEADRAVAAEGPPTEEHGPPFDETGPPLGEDLEPGEESEEQSEDPLEPLADEPTVVQEVGTEPAEDVEEADQAIDEPADESEEDLLEETPEFLRDTPESDRMWFEQGKPQGFDFEDDED